MRPRRTPFDTRHVRFDWPVISFSSKLRIVIAKLRTLARFCCVHPRYARAARHCGESLIRLFYQTSSPSCFDPTIFLSKLAVANQFGSLFAARELTPMAFKIITLTSGCSARPGVKGVVLAAKRNRAKTSLLLASPARGRLCSVTEAPPDLAVEGWGGDRSMSARRQLLGAPPWEIFGRTRASDRQP